jgi:nucleotide-binding universal stress UspA family protein
MRLLTLKRVLVATDLDHDSGPVLRTAARLAHLAGAELHLLYVEREPTKDGAARLMEHFARAAPEAPQVVSVRVLPGNPAEEIVNRARDLDVDAVILGPHRGGNRSDGGLGSTAAEVVRTASCPCLVAAAELSLPMERVLAAVDLTDEAIDVLDVALSWASALRPRATIARLDALHVAPEPSSETAAGAIREKVERVRAAAGRAARVELEECVTSGSDPADSILHEAVAREADLLVIGTRGAVKPGSELGSVSAAVARATRCPLLLVPPTSITEADS